jgi:hypothetical protein
MAWFLRAVEAKGGQWSCRWGTLEYDVHDELGVALAHLRYLAGEIGTSVLFVHPRHGPIQRVNPASVRGAYQECE